MMPTFVQVGNHWINMERVTNIELVEDKRTPGNTIAAYVYYSSGQKQAFEVPEAVEDLASWLRAHRGP
jgi:hypothetical protein